MRYDAGEERWMPKEIRGVRGYFNGLGIVKGEERHVLMERRR